MFQSLREISEKKNMSLYAVRSLLKEELGDEYEEYKYGTSIPKLKRHKVIEFWKQGNSLKKINCLTGFSIAKIKIILAEKLEKLDDKYSVRLTYEEIKQLVPQKKLTQIIELAERRKNVHEISDISKFPIKFIKSYLKEEVSHRLRFNINEFSTDSFEQIYDALTLKMIMLKQKSFGSKSKSSAAQIISRTIQDINKLKDLCIRQYYNVRNTLATSSKYMNVNILGPIFIYHFLKVNGLNFSLHSILPYLQVDKREYFIGLKKINPFFTHEYGTRDRKFQVMSIIEEVSTFFDLGYKFYQNAQTILHRLWELLQNTTDEVLAGVICVLSVISINNESISVNTICGKIGITPSSVIYQVRNKLFKVLKISGFTTLRKSKALIRKEIFEKMVEIK